MTLSCTIQGNPVSIIVGSFSASYVLNNRPTASLSVYYETTPAGDEGDEVVVTRTSDSATLFAGRITLVRISVDEAGNKFASYSLSGHEVLADRRIVAEVYINRSAGYIVKDLIDKYLSADGITEGTIDDGITIPRAVFGYQQLSDVLRVLAEANGYIWYIDTAKALHFTERDLLTAPYAIDEAVAGDRPIRALRYDKSLTQYRNRQFIQYNELTSVRTESFTGDGSTQTFGVEFPIALKPAINVNGIAQTVGIAAVSDNTQWYWSKGENTVTQQLSDKPMTVDGRIANTSVSIDVPYLRSIRAKGNYTVATYVQTGTANCGLVLFRTTGDSLEVMQTIPFTLDNTFGIFDGWWIDDTHYVVQYYEQTPNTTTQDVYERLGDVLRSTVVTATLDNVFLSQKPSNGRHTVATKNTITDFDLLLYTFDLSAGTLTQTGIVNYDSSYSVPTIVVDGYYAVWLQNNLTSSNAARLGLLKIDVENDTWTQVDTIDLADPYKNLSSRIIIIGNYVFVFIFGIAGQIHFKIYKIDTATDELVFVRDWSAPSWLQALTPAVDSIDNYGNRIIVYGSFSGGDIAVITFDDEAEDLNVTAYLENEINGNISLSDAGFGVYDRVASGDDAVRMFRFVPDVLDVTYQGSFRNVTQIDEFTEQADRVNVEGGTGIYESFQSALSVDGEAAAIDLAQSVLSRYGTIPRIVTFETQTQGYDTGQIIDINWPSIGIIDEKFLIESLNVRDDSGSALWYQIRCISGIDVGNWQEFWRSLRDDGQRYDFGGADILPKVAAVQDMVMAVDEVTTASAAVQTDWDEGNWDQMEWQ